MVTVGIRELKNNLSHYMRKVMAGHRVTVTDRGKPVAEIIPPRSPHAQASRYDELVARGLIRPAIEDGDPLEGFPVVKLPRGTARELIDEDREER